MFQTCHVEFAHPSPGTTVATVSGELDLADADALRKTLTDQLADGVSLVIDLRELQFIGSTGIGALLAVRDEADRTAATVAVVATTPSVLRPLTLLGLLDQLNVRETLD